MIYPNNIYISPQKAILRFSQIMKRCHLEAIKKGNNYRLEKEALDCAVFLNGVENIYGGQYWFRNAEDVSRDIDIQVIHKVPHTSIPYIDQFDLLQITQFESHNKDISDVLKSKQKPGYDPGDIELVIVARDKLGWEFLPEEKED